MYILRVVQLLATFRAFGQSGVVSIEPTQQQAEGSWKAFLQLQEGEVTSCYVQQKSTKQLLWQGAEAMQWLETQESLQWELDESPKAALPVVSGGVDRLMTESNPFNEGDHYQPGQQELSFPSNGWSVYEQKAEPFSLVPQRTHTRREGSEALPRDYKRVFALVDGQRTNAQIATLLHYPSQRVAELLRELQAKGLVEL